MLKIIQYNPYRFLGVCSNAPVAERLANSRRINAFLKVNREISFPLDLSDMMPAISRSVEELNVATNGINLPHDQLKYALFWFISKSPIDKMALEYLQKGNSSKALELWGKKEDFSSLINKGVLSFILNDNGTAIECITKVIHDDVYRLPFVESVCGSTFKIEEDELAQIFMESLLAECRVSELVNLFERYGVSGDDNDFLKEKSIEEPIEAINSAIAQCKNTKSDDAQAQYKSGMNLMDSTKEHLRTLRSILGESDAQYQMVADNLAKHILQCGINYHNNTKEDEDIKIDKTYKLQSYALSIAVGRLTKDRCKDNVDILERKKKELPPKEVRYYDKFIREAIDWYVSKPNKISFAIDLIKKTVPYLMSIKEVLGGNNTYYLKISTLIVNLALHNVIEEFNNATEKFDNNIPSILQLHIILQSAWEATLYMDKLDMESEFRKERYNPNRNSLKRQAEEIINVYQSVTLDMRGETKIFNDCSKINDCNEYFRLFPEGKYVSQVKEKLERFEFDACRTTIDCRYFQTKYPRSKHPINVKLEYCHFNQCKTVGDYKGYLASYPKGRYVPQAKAFVDDEEFWSRCVSSGSKDLYKQYLAKFPNGRYRAEAEQKASACYIATMVYGDYNHPQVMALRSFRDDTLQNSSLGRAFIRFYYKNSPAWVEKMQGKKTLNAIIKTVLDNFIKTIQ